MLNIYISQCYLCIATFNLLTNCAFLSLGLLEVSQGEIGLIHLFTQLIQLVHQGPGKLNMVLKTMHGPIHLLTQLIQLVHKGPGKLNMVLKTITSTF